MTTTLINPKRPYFVRAMHEWLTDNEFTPYLVVDSTHDELVAPTQYAQNGQLVLSVSYTATKDLYIDNDALSFSARFGGVSEELWIPMGAVLGIFAKEDQSQGLFFDPQEYANVPKSEPTKPEPEPKKTEPQSQSLGDTPKKGGLRIIK